MERMDLTRAGRVSVYEHMYDVVDENSSVYSMFGTGNCDARHTGQEMVENCETRHTCQEMPRHTDQEITRQTGREMVENCETRHIGQMMVENCETRHTGQEMPRHTDQEMSRQTGREMVENCGTRHTGQEMVENCETRHTGQEMPRHTGQEMPRHTGQWMVEICERHTGQEMPRHTGQEMPRHTGQGMVCCQRETQGYINERSPIFDVADSCNDAYLERANQCQMDSSRVSINQTNETEPDHAFLEIPRLERVCTSIKYCNLQPFQFDCGRPNHTKTSIETVSEKLEKKAQISSTESCNNMPLQPYSFLYALKAFDDRTQNPLICESKVYHKQNACACIESIGRCIQEETRAHMGILQNKLNDNNSGSLLNIVEHQSRHDERTENSEGTYSPDVSLSTPLVVTLRGDSHRNNHCGVTDENRREDSHRNHHCGVTDEDKRWGSHRNYLCGVTDEDKRGDSHRNHHCGVTDEDKRGESHRNHKCGVTDKDRRRDSHRNYLCGVTDEDRRGDSHRNHHCGVTDKDRRGDSHSNHHCSITDENRRGDILRNQHCSVTDDDRREDSHRNHHCDVTDENRRGGSHRNHNCGVTDDGRRRELPTRTMLWFPLTLCLIVGLVNPVLFTIVLYYSILSVRRWRRRRYRRAIWYLNRAAAVAISGLVISLVTITIGIVIVRNGSYERSDDTTLSTNECNFLKQNFTKSVLSIPFTNTCPPCNTSTEPPFSENKTMGTTPTSTTQVEHFSDMDTWTGLPDNMNEMNFINDTCGILINRSTGTSELMCV